MCCLSFSLRTRARSRAHDSDQMLCCICIVLAAGRLEALSICTCVECWKRDFKVKSYVFIRFTPGLMISNEYCGKQSTPEWISFALIVGYKR